MANPGTAEQLLDQDATGDPVVDTGKKDFALPSELSTAPAASASLAQMAAGKGSGLSTSEHDPRDVADREVSFNSPLTNPSEPMVGLTVDGVLTNHDALRARWDEREKKEGKTVYYAPMEKGAERKFFDTIEQCQAHIDAIYPNVAEMHKLQKSPKRMYEPQSHVISPPRRLEDFVSPEVAERMRKATDVAKDLQPILEQQKAALQGNNRGSILMMGSEAIAIQQLSKLTDEELTSIGRRAHYGGKTQLARRARQECLRRKLPSPF